MTCSPTARTASRRHGPRQQGRRRSAIVAAAIGLGLAVLAGACSSGRSSSSGAPGTSPTSAVGVAGSSRHPDIVFILTDDLSWNLITPEIAPHIVELERRGETFDHYVVADSLCCPSRSTIFTGLYPHDTHVVTNLPPDGGYSKFRSEHLDTRTYAAALHDAGYRTSMLGKYLNGYGTKNGDDHAGQAMTPTGAPVPPGWTDWHVSNNTGYAEYDFLLNDNGTINRYTGDDDYGVDVINRDTQSFITANHDAPFVVEAATFAPHAPYTPATRNADDFPGLTEPRDPSFDAQNVDPPTWLGQRPPLRPKQVDTIDASYRKRAQAVESVDKLLADTEATLAEEHLTDDTYIVFSSDNGYHLGQHRLARGKQTAFDTDIRVPLIVAGPGVPHAATMHQVVQNTDLAPTIEQLAGVTGPAAVDGTSIEPLLHPRTTTPWWPTVALVEHQGGDSSTDPDFEGGGSNPTTYEAIRISAAHLPGFTGPVEATYVEYADPQHELEFYDLATDPYELTNAAAQLTAAQRTELHEVLTHLVGCHTAATCTSARRPSGS